MNVMIGVANPFPVRPIQKQKSSIAIKIRIVPLDVIAPIVAYAKKQVFANKVQTVLKASFVTNVTRVFLLNALMTRIAPMIQFAAMENVSFKPVVKMQIAEAAPIAKTAVNA